MYFKVCFVTFYQMNNLRNIMDLLYSLYNCLDIFLNKFLWIILSRLYWQRIRNSNGCCKAHGVICIIIIEKKRNVDIVDCTLYDNDGVDRLLVVVFAVFADGRCWC